MRNRKKIILAVCIMATSLLTACAAGGSAAEKAADSSKDSAGYPVVVADSDGNRLEIGKKPERIVSMAPSITELFYKMNLEEYLVGRTDYCDYPKEASTISSVGTLTTPDIEKIVSLEPDLVIASTHFSEESQKQLEDIGVPILVMQDQNNMEDVYTLIETVGTIFHEEDQAGNIIKEMKASIEETTRAVEGFAPPSVYYVVGFGEYGDYTAGGDTFVGQLISLAGGDNIAKDMEGWSYTLESLIEKDPDIIILPEEMREEFLASDNYKEISAVKNGKVYGVDKSILERPGYRNSQGVRVLAEILHPDAFH